MNKEKRWIESVINVNRCTKVTKGGRTFSFSVIVVIGDTNGCIGYGLGKSSEIIDAKYKAIKEAKKNIHNVLLHQKRTIYHDIEYKFCSSKIIMRRAYLGKGVIANGIIRKICNVIGIKDIVVKSLRSNNPHNLTRAIILALINIKSPNDIRGARKKTS